VDKRTALVNQLRGLLMERGVVIEKGINHVRKELPLILVDPENGLTSLSRELFTEHYDKLKELDKAIKSHDQRIVSKTNAANAVRGVRRGSHHRPHYCR
jgi:transposase